MSSRKREAIKSIVEHKLEELKLALQLADHTNPEELKTINNEFKKIKELADKYNIEI